MTQLPYCVIPAATFVIPLDAIMLVLYCHRFHTIKCTTRIPSLELRKSQIEMYLHGYMKEIILVLYKKK